MPISRYEIRNEYGLADPDLYRAAGKDDPESLLEGIAMAGLVGVLRQLGDLAEFAADIFHNLHEEAMATAARSHGLMSRVQQIETEIPHIERAFLSQIDHSSFFNHTVGVDWHPNLQIDQNLITQGDLPRLVMDSYEECRPPPRLFLLDKFDVEGAGACLKRYSDPSFFKVENYGMTNADVVPREKKIRKGKKKGPKNGETTEVLQTSHTKLHQLFMEEARIENGGKNPAHRAKLKRKLNGFPFNTKTGNNYMEKFLKDTSPDNKVVHEVTMNSSPLVSATFDYNESGLQVVEVRPVSPHIENLERERSPPSFSDREITVNSSINDKTRQAPNLYLSIATDVGISSTHNEKVIDMDSYGEGSLTGYQFDDIVSEVDNYVDATSLVESDTDENSTLRVNSDFTPSHLKSDSLISDENEENLQIMSFDSQSTGDLTISDEDNNSSRKGMSSFTSDSPTTSVENPQSKRISTRVFSPVVSDVSRPNAYAITNPKSDYEQTTSYSRVVGKGMLKGIESDKTVSTLDDEKKRSTLVVYPPCSPSVSDAELHSGDVSRKSSAVPYIPSHKTADSSDKVTSNLLHWDEYDSEVQNPGENRAFKFNLFNVHSWGTIGNPSEMNSSETLIPDQLDEFQNLPKDFPSDYPDIVHNGDNEINSTVSKEDNRIRRMDNGYSGISNDSPNQFLCFMDTFLKKKLEEASSPDAETIDDEDDHSERSIGNHISSKDLVLSHLENSSDWPWEGHDAHERDFIPEEYMAVNEDLVPGTRIGITHHISLDESEAHESSCSTPGEIEEPTGSSEYLFQDETKSNGQEVTENLPDEVHTLPLEDKSNTADIVFAVPALSDHASTGNDVTECSVSDDMISLNEVHILLGESDKSTVADLASPVPALSDNVMMDNIPSHIGLAKQVEEKVHSFEDSGIDELEIANNPLSESRWKLGLAEKVDQTEAATSGFENNDQPQSEVSGITVPKSHVDVKAAGQCLELVHPETPKLPVEQSFLNGEHEIPQQSSLGNHVSDSPSLHVADYEFSEESIVQEDIGLQSRGIYSEVPPVLPRINDQQMPNLLGSILPLSETDLTNTPPLPPLPPAQWMMMGKLQFGSSSLFPQLISHPTGSTDYHDDNSRFYPPTTSTNNDRYPLEEITHSPIQTANDPASKEKFQLVSSSPFIPLISHPTRSTDDDDSSSRNCPPTESTNGDRSPREEITLYPIQTANEPTLKEKLQLGSSSPFPQIISHPTSSTDGDDASYRCSPPNRSPLEEITHPPIQTANANEPASKEKPHLHLSSTEGEIIQHNDIFPQIIFHPIVYTDEIKKSPIQIPDKPASKEEKGESSGVEVNSMHECDLASKEDKVESSCMSVNSMHEADPASKEEKAESSHVEVSSRHETVDLTPVSDNNQQPSVMMAEEDGVANGSEAVKLPRLRHPLIDEFTALDKSKLKKVSVQLRPPQVHKVDVRDSMLEQIRTKSFNLKPAMAIRPSYRGPSTNLKVAAIVEKANAIRQAFAGSDEDDDDSWSDS